MGSNAGRVTGAATRELQPGVPASNRDYVIATNEGEKDMRRSAVIGTVLVAVVLAGCSDTTSEPTATYTGGACNYDGPSEFDLNTTVTFTVTNESDTTQAGFAIWDFPEGLTSEEIHEQGIFAFVTSGNFADIAFSPTAIGEPEDLTVLFDTPGQWGLNCFDLSGGENGGSGLDYVTMFTVNA